ncbi:hypothetical protein PRO82_001983 [Candidatus Protochlamydia amoebophila]|nr:hypothetical protein [Candidatus Protochlamydia amoebophila]
MHDLTILWFKKNSRCKDTIKKKQPNQIKILKIYWVVLIDEESKSVCWSLAQLLKL